MANEANVRREVKVVVVKVGRKSVTLQVNGTAYILAAGDSIDMNVDTNVRFS